MSDRKITDVRTAVPEDAEHFANIFAMLHSEVGRDTLDISYVNDLFNSAMNTRDVVIGVIGDVGEPLKAFIVLGVGRPWYSTTFTLSEYGTFVHPEFRKTDYFKQLVDFAKNMSDALGLDLFVGIQHSGRSDAKVRLYKKFFEECATQFRYQPKTLGDPSHVL